MHERKSCGQETIVYKSHTKKGYVSPKTIYEIVDWRNVFRSILLFKAFKRKEKINVGAIILTDNEFDWYW